MTPLTYAKLESYLGGMYTLQSLARINKAPILILIKWLVVLDLMELMLLVLNNYYFCFSEYLCQQSSNFLTESLN